MKRQELKTLIQWNYLEGGVVPLEHRRVVKYILLEQSNYWTANEESYQ